MIEATPEEPEGEEPQEDTGDLPRGSRAMRTVTDVRHELFRVYWMARRKRMKTSEAFSLAQILTSGAKLMVETEPLAELREVSAENTALKAQLAEVKSELEVLKKAWAPRPSPVVSRENRPN